MTDYPARVEHFAEWFWDNIRGMSKIDAALLRLDKLAQEEHRMATALGLKAMHDVRDQVHVVGGGV